MGRSSTEEARSEAAFRLPRRRRHSRYEGTIIICISFVLLITRSNSPLGCGPAASITARRSVPRRPVLMSLRMTRTSAEFAGSTSALATRFFKLVSALTNWAQDASRRSHTASLGRLDTWNVSPLHPHGPELHIGVSPSLQYWTCRNIARLRSFLATVAEVSLASASRRLRG